VQQRRHIPGAINNCVYEVAFRERLPCIRVSIFEFSGVDPIPLELATVNLILEKKTANQKFAG
jgi:hypothetical protein